jgi:putative transcription factor
MECDLCGKPATVIATIEGARLSACPACARHGTIIRPIPMAAPKGTKRQISAPDPKEELIETVRQDVGKLLQQHREKLKLNQEQFAAKLQIRASTYNHYESGAVVPDTVMARKLERILGVPLVVHVKVGAGVVKNEERRGMTMGDFFKKA